MRKNYLSNLIHYLEDFRKVSIDSEKQLKNISDYLKSRLNSESATDKTVMLQVNNLLEKFSYVSKYIDITIDFYKELM